LSPQNDLPKCPTCDRVLFQVHADRKLSDDDVMYILDNPKDYSQIRLARMFDVDASLISKIRNGRAYADISAPYLAEQEAKKSG